MLIDRMDDGETNAWLDPMDAETVAESDRRPPTEADSHLNDDDERYYWFYRQQHGHWADGGNAPQPDPLPQGEFDGILC